MKVFFFSVTLIFVFISCKSDINDKKYRNDKWAWWIDAKTGKGQWIPLSNKPTWQNGKYTKFYTTGEVYEIGKIKNGKHVDTTYFYDLNNKLLDYRLIKSNDTSYYFINDGKVKIYNQDKSLLAEGIIQNHTYGDKWIKYYHNGNKEFTDDYINGTGWEVTYYENGQIQDSIYHQRGFDSGVVLKSWYSNGQISEIADWKGGVSNGAYKKYYQNGQLQKSTFFINGKEEGTSKEWYETLRGIFKK